MFKRLSYIMLITLLQFVCTQSAIADSFIEPDQDEFKVVACRYWIDDEESNKQEVELIDDLNFDLNIDANLLSKGKHICHIQFKNTERGWGEINSIPFYTGIEQEEKENDDISIISYEHWIDNDSEHKTEQKYTTENITCSYDVSQLENGLHSFYFATTDQRGMKTIATSTFYVLFPKLDDSINEEDNKIVAYQYWLDGDMSTIKEKEYTSNEIETNIDVSNITGGLHTISYRFKSADNKLSSEQKLSFYTIESNIEAPDTEQLIAGYRAGTVVNETEKSITSISSIPSIDIDIPMLKAKDAANVESYTFKILENEDKVKAIRNIQMVYFAQFKNQRGEWGEIVYADSTMSDQVIVNANEMNLQRTLGIKKLDKDEFTVVKFNIPTDNSYYLGTSSDCKMMLYKDGVNKATLTAQDLHSNNTLFLQQGTYYAIIYTQDKDASIRLTASKNWVVDPEFRMTGGALNITTTQSGASIYYTTDGSMPSKESNLYTGPIPITYNGVVKAIAICDGMADSYIKSFNIEIFDTQTCPQPQIIYDGRKVKLESEVANATIYYTEDGTEPNLEDAKKYTNEGIYITSLGSIKAISTKDLMNNSEVATYEIPAYYDGKSQVEVQTAGSLSKAFEWNNGEALSDSLQVLGNINLTDAATIKAMSGIKYLDLNKVNVDGNTLPNQAFANMNLRSASLPASLTSCGSDLFAGNKQLSAVIWNANNNMPTEVLSGIDNPNLLLYVNTKSYAPASINNVVAGGIADNIVLSEPSAEQTSDGNFYAPQPFTAKKISYTRDFKQETEIGVCQGWETISLPFDAQTITHETNGNIAPFAKGDKEARPFWLYELAPNGGFQATATIKANTPYIISMPNSQAYSDEYILGGKVTFAASDVNIEATEQASTKNNSREFVTSFEQIGKQNGVYALNVGQEYQGYRPGSIFAENFVDVKPFEAYLTTAEAAAKFSSFFNHDDSTTGIDDIPTKQMAGLNVWTNGSTLYIRSDKARTVQVFSTTGMLVKSVKIEASEIQQITSLPAGIYIVNKKKVAVR